MRHNKCLKILDLMQSSPQEPPRRQEMAAVLSQAPAEERQVQHAPLYEQAPIQEPQHEREMSVGVSARTPSAEPGTQQALHASQGRGGRPKSSVWKHFTTEGKREDKSKREDVRCRC